MKDIISKELEVFSTINLEQLNAYASLLDRMDKKYLLTKFQLKEIITELKEKFYILQIWEKKIFSYDNIYMDTEDYKFYNDHQSRKKNRIKVRTRLYEDSDLAFFEFKQKKGWVTRKFRYEFPVTEHWIMTKWKTRFFEWVYKSFYPLDEVPQIFPSIKTKYKRITLVSKDSSERVTIDFDIKVSDLRNKWKEKVDLKDLVIIESKSMSESAFITDLMIDKWFNRARSCSKYSLWIIYSKLTEKFDTFKETIDEIEKIKKWF